MIDLDRIPGAGDGVQWALHDGEDLNANLVHLGPGTVVGDHVVDEVDVLLVVLDGSGSVVIDGRAADLDVHVVVCVTKGSRRRIEAGPDGLCYLTVHRRRTMTIRSRAR